MTSPPWRVADCIGHFASYLETNAQTLRKLFQVESANKIHPGTWVEFTRSKSYETFSADVHQRGNRITLFLKRYVIVTPYGQSYLAFVYDVDRDCLIVWDDGGIKPDSNPLQVLLDDVRDD